MQVKVPRTPTPLYWRDEQSGKMRQAVEAYLNHCLEHTPLTQDQLALVIDYCDAWISCPVWNDADKLRESIKKVKTVKELHKWLHDALNVGIDPL